MTALQILFVIVALAIIVALVGLLASHFWPRIAEPDPLDSEREYKRGTPGDRDE